MDRRFRGYRRRVCPKCGAEMQEEKITQYIQIDVCPKCRGTWFDHGELKELLHARISERADPRTLAKAERTEYECPNCGRALFERKFLPRSDIHIDQCIHCAGIFLDAGELQQVKEFLLSIGMQVRDWETAH